jgi:hypothetical protein
MQWDADNINISHGRSVRKIRTETKQIAVPHGIPWISGKRQPPNDIYIQLLIWSIFRTLYINFSLGHDNSIFITGFAQQDFLFSNLVNLPFREVVLLVGAISSKCKFFFQPGGVSAYFILCFHLWGDNRNWLICPSKKPGFAKQLGNTEN